MPATRCRECHGTMYQEWKTSAHARSASSATYLAARKQAGTAAQCDTCHIPLGAAGSSDQRAVSEGVTCDVCHTIKDVTIAAGNSRFTMQLKDAVKFGPFCDAKDHYFHRMACAESQTNGTLCAACHQRTIRTPRGNELPVYTTYSDWKSGPANDDGMVCQHCHMPAVRGEAAVGAGPRPHIRNHGFLGKAGALRRRAVTLSLQITERAGKLHIDLGVTNSGAGHYIPSGLPARRVLIRLRTLDAGGTQVDRYEHAHGRMLIDGAGKAAPYYLAETVHRDTRIGARKTSRLQRTLRAPGAGTLHIEVLWRPFAHAVAKRMGIAPGTDQLMIEHRVKFGAPGKRGLPGKPVIVKP